MIKLNAVRRFLKDVRGANMVEYILLVGVVALISIVAFKTFGGKVQDKIKEQGNTVGQINAGQGQLAAERIGYDLGPRAGRVKSRQAAAHARGFVASPLESSCC
jgi:Flp pilus assembly pilin Flp